MTDDDNRQGKRSKATDRVVLTNPESDKVQKWMQMLNEHLDGAVRLTRSDLVNFIIREHSDDFSDLEIKKIESEFYSEIRWLNWATAKVRTANKEGIKLSLNDLIAKRPTAAPAKSPKTIKSRKADLKNHLITITENQEERSTADSAGDTK